MRLQTCMVYQTCGQPSLTIFHVLIVRSKQPISLLRRCSFGSKSESSCRIITTHNRLNLPRASSPRLPPHDSQSDGMILLLLVKLTRAIGLQKGSEVRCVAIYPSLMFTTFQDTKSYKSALYFAFFGVTLSSHTFSSSTSHPLLLRAIPLKVLLVCTF